VIDGPAPVPAPGPEATNDATAVLPRRVLAFALDAVVPLVVFVLLFAVLGKTYDKQGDFIDLSGVHVCNMLRARTDAAFCFETSRTAHTLTGLEAAAVLVIPALLSLVNLVVLQGVVGASVGKQITRLRVVDAAGGAPGMGRALVRWVLLVVDGACLLGLLIAAVTRPHRRIGDVVAGTYVIGAGAGRAEPVATGTLPGPAPATGAFSQPAPTTFTTGPSAPVWDEQRRAWISYDPVRRAWLGYDDATGEWRPL
jgi:uncharacterized RDD family membrane protein YckC